MGVYLLNKEQYKGVQSPTLEEEGIESGVGEGTHTASIDFGDKKPVKCFVKFYRDSGSGLLNETLGYLIAKKLEIIQPRRAGILAFPVKFFEIVKCPEWLDLSQNSTGKILCWATEEITGKSLKAHYKSALYLEIFLKTLIEKNSKEMGGIAALDYLTGNGDRNLGNIVRLSPAVHAIIDQGALLGSEFWPTVGIPNEIPNIIIEEIAYNRLFKKGLLDHNCLKKLQDHTANSYERNVNAINDLQPTIERWVTLFYPDRVSDVIQFLKQRAPQSWVAHKLGTLF